MLRPSCLLRFAPALLAAAAPCACGDPGVATPMPEPPTIDTGGVVGRESAAGADLGGGPRVSVTFDAGPGATTAGALILTTNLDTTAPPTRSFARADGSFGITAVATQGDTLRLQAVLDGLRGPPVDFLYTGSFTPVTRPPCLAVTPALALTFEDGAAGPPLTLANGCAGPVTLESPRARLGLPDFTLEAALPLTLEPGREATLRVRFAPGASGEREDVLFLDASGTPDGTVRYPITLFGEGP